MDLDHVPLLATQRELYALPRGRERFREYLRRLIDAASGDLALPLASMNPMGKEHLPLFLDRLLALDADRLAAESLAELRAELEPEPGRYRVGLCVADDLGGGWTDRAAAEFGQRFAQEALARRGWVVPLLWTSETYAAPDVVAATRAAVLRQAWVQRHGAPRTLGERLRQEHAVMRAAGMREVELEPGELARTRAVLAPHLGSSDWPTAVAALFGDAAARRLGLQPLGLADRAGLALARQDALPG